MFLLNNNSCAHPSSGLLYTFNSCLYSPLLTMHWLMYPSMHCTLSQWWYIDRLAVCVCVLLLHAHASSNDGCAGDRRLRQILHGTIATACSISHGRPCMPWPEHMEVEESSMHVPRPSHCLQYHTACSQAFPLSAVSYCMQTNRRGTLTYCLMPSRPSLLPRLLPMLRSLGTAVHDPGGWTHKGVYTQASLWSLAVCNSFLRTARDQKLYEGNGGVLVTKVVHENQQLINFSLQRTKIC